MSSKPYESSYMNQTYSDMAPVLPPGLETLSDTVYGVLIIKVGKILWIKNKYQTDHSLVKVKFWGDNGSGQILRPSNSAQEFKLTSSEIRYDVKSSIMHFSKYLEDMGKLNLYVLDARNHKAIGCITLNLLFFLKKNLSPKDIAPLENINGIFPIHKISKGMGKEVNMEKIGDIELDIVCIFEKEPKKGPSKIPKEEMIPKVSKNLQDSANKHLTSSFLMNEMKSQTEGFGMEEPAKLDQPQANNYYNRDTRIAKSLLPTMEKNYDPDHFKEKIDVFEPLASKNPMNMQTGINNERNSFYPRTQNQNLQSYYPPANSSVSNKPFYETKRATDVDADHFDSQIDQLILRAGNALQIGQSRPFDENSSIYHQQQRPNPYEIFPNNLNMPANNNTYSLFQPTKDIKLDIDKTALDQSIELEKLKLKIDDAALLDADNKQETLEKKEKEVLTLDKIDTLRMTICEFECENQNLKERLKGENIYIEVLVPNLSLSSDINPIYDTFKFYTKEIPNSQYNNKFIFNNEVSQTFNINEGQLKSFINGSVQYKIYMHAQASQSKNQQPEDIRLEMAYGSFPLEKIILSPGYSGSFVVKMFSKIPLDKATQQQQPTKTATLPKKDSKAPQKVAKSQTNLVKAEVETQIGEITLNCKLLSSKGNYITPVETQNTRAPNEIRRQVEPINEGNTYLPLQMLLYIQKIPKIKPRDQLDFPFRNIYAAYKIYGSNESVKTDVRWKTNTPYIDHKMIFPLNYNLIADMEAKPFILEIWDKSESSKDQLLGLVKMNLNPVSQTLIDAETGEINTTYIKSNTYPIIVHDDLLPIMDLKSGQEFGLIQVMLAVGTPGQLSKFESRIKDKRSKYSEMNDNASPAKPKPSKQITTDNKPTRDKSPPKPAITESPFKKFEINYSKLDEEVLNLNAYETFIKVLEHLRRKSQGFGDYIKKFLNNNIEETINHKEFSEFLMDPALGLKSSYVKKVIILLDPTNKGYISKDHFSKSLIQYIGCEERIRKRFTELLKNLRILLNQQNISLSSLEKSLNRNSEFGYIKKLTFKNTLEELNLNIGQGSLEYLLGILDYNNDGYIFISHLLDYLKTLEIYNELNYLNQNTWFIIDTVVSDIKALLLQNKQNIERLDDIFNEIIPNDIEYINIDIAIKIFLKLSCVLSFWEILSLFEYLKIKSMIINNKDEDRVQILANHLYNWIIDIEELRKSKESFANRINPKISSSDNKNNLRQSVESNESLDDIISGLNVKKNNVENQPKIKEESNEEESNQQIQPTPAITKPVEEGSKARDEDNIPKKYNKGVLRHSIVVCIQELNNLRLAYAMQGTNCALRYIFPSEEEPIESNIFEYSINTKDYPLQMKSKHTWLLPRRENLLNQLDNTSNGILVQFCSKEDELDEILGNTIIPFDDLTELVTTTQSNPTHDERSNKLERNLFLYKTNQAAGLANELVLGKLKVVLEYKVEHPLIDESEEDQGISSQKEILYEKEISVQRLIPKNGNIGLSLSKLTLFRKSVEQLKQLYPQAIPTLENMNQISKSLKLYVNIFHESQQLQDETDSKGLPPFEILIDDCYWDLNHFEINFQISQSIEITPQIVEYLQNKTAKLELKLIIDNNPNISINHESFDTKNSKNHISLGATTIALLPLIANQKGIQGDYELSTGNILTGLLNLCITLGKDKVPPQANNGPRNLLGKIGLPDKRYYKFYLNIVELLNYIEFNDKYIQNENTEGLLYFTFDIDGDIKRSIYHNINKRNKYHEFEDDSFMIDFDLNSDIFKKPIEIKIIEKKKPKFVDEIIGLANLDLSKILRIYLKTQKSYHKSVYAFIYDSKTGKPLQMRLGLNLLVSSSDNSNELKRLHNYMNILEKTMIDKKCRAILEKDKKREGIIDKNLFQDLIRKESNLTYSELEDFMKIIFDSNDMIEYGVFMKKICPQYECDTRITQDTAETLLKEFKFNDYNNEGLADHDTVDMIYRQYSTLLRGLSEDYLLKFYTKDTNSDLEKMLPYDFKKAKDKFDYIVFLHKISSKSEIGSTAVDLDRIYSKTRQVDDYLSNTFGASTKMINKPTIYDEEPRSYSPITLQININSGKNFQNLNNNIPPNSLIRCEFISNSNAEPIFIGETNVAQRSIEPWWAYSVQYTIDPRKIDINNAQLNFNVFHRGYNENYLEKMQKLELIGRFMIPLNEIFGKFTSNSNIEAQIEKSYSVSPLHSTNQINRKPLSKTNLGSMMNSKPAEVNIALKCIPESVAIREKKEDFIDFKRNTFGQSPYINNKFDDQEREDPNIEFKPETIANVFKTLEEINRNTSRIGSPDRERLTYLDEDINPFATKYDNAYIEPDAVAEAGYLEGAYHSLKDLETINKDLDDILRFSNVNRYLPEQDDLIEPKKDDTFKSTNPISNPWQKNLGPSLNEDLKLDMPDFNKNNIEPKGEMNTIDERKPKDEESYSIHNGKDNPVEKNIDNKLYQDKPPLGRLLDGDLDDNFSQKKPGSTSNNSGNPNNNKVSSSNSSKTLRNLENKFPKNMRDSEEISRIAKIMKQNFSKKNSAYDYSSDSDA